MERPVLVFSCSFRPRQMGYGEMRKLLVLAVFAVTAHTAVGDMFILSDPSGLAAEVEFTLLGPNTLEVRARNISTGVPAGFDSADQILTGISWDFGHPGYNGDTMITGGTVLIGPTSESVNFDTGWYGPGTDVSGEWGYGNEDGTGALTNFITAHNPPKIPRIKANTPTMKPPCCFPPSRFTAEAPGS